MADGPQRAGPPTYPVHLKLAGRPVLVVGAGEVGLRKAEGLLAAGALVTVVAPTAVPGIAELAARGRLRHEARPYRAGEAGEHDLAFAATGVPEVDARVAADAAAAGVPVNVADVPHLCSFYLPAVVRRGPLALTVITDGRAPFASRRLRRLLWGPAMADWAAAAAAFRQAVSRPCPRPPPASGSSTASWPRPCRRPPRCSRGCRRKRNGAPGCGRPAAAPRRTPDERHPERFAPARDRLPRRRGARRSRAADAARRALVAGLRRDCLRPARSPPPSPPTAPHGRARRRRRQDRAAASRSAAGGSPTPDRRPRARRARASAAQGRRPVRLRPRRRGGARPARGTASRSRSCRASPRASRPPPTPASRRPSAARRCASPSSPRTRTRQGARRRRLAGARLRSAGDVVAYMGVKNPGQIAERMIAGGCGRGRAGRGRRARHAAVAARGGAHARHSRRAGAARRASAARGDDRRSRRRPARRPRLVRGGARWAGRSW